VNAAVASRTFGLSSKDVGAIDGWVETVGTQWGRSARTLFRTRVCIAELAANVLKHGAARSADDHIVVTLRQAGDGIEVEFRDSCGPFDPTRVPVVAKADSLQSLRPGGWGLVLLHAFAKDLAYVNDGTCNRVTMKIKSA